MESFHICNCGFRHLARVKWTQPCFEEFELESWFLNTLQFSTYLTLFSLFLHVSFCYIIYLSHLSLIFLLFLYYSSCKMDQIECKSFLFEVWGYIGLSLSLQTLINTCMEISIKVNNCTSKKNCKFNF